MKQVLLILLSLIVGAGAGLGAGYAGLNPQVNDLVAKNSAVEELQRDNIFINAEIESLRRENLQLGEELSKLKSEMDSLMKPDVRLVGEIKSEKVIENGKEGYTLSGMIANFGLEDAEQVKVRVVWMQPTACGCDVEIGHEEITILDRLQGRSMRELKGAYFFTLRELISVEANLSWD